MISIYSIPTLAGALFSAGIGLFVFLRNRRSPLNIAFGLFCLSLFGWLFGYTITYTTRSDLIAIIFTRVACTAVAFTAPAFHFLTAAYLHLNSEKKWVVFSYLLMCIQLPFFIFTDHFLQFPYKYYWGYYSKAGLLHPLHLAVFFAIFFRGYYLLWRNYRRISSISALEANRIRYIFIAYAVTALGTMDYLPKYGFEFYPFGFIFEIMFAFIIAYAIFKYQLLDIEVIIKKTLVFAGLLASVFAILVVPTLIIQEYLFGAARTSGKIMGLTISGVIIIFTMRRIEKFLINATDKYLFQKKYNYKELLKTFTAEVLTVLNLNDLVDLTVTKLVDIIKLKSCAVLLFNSDKQQFSVMASHNIKDPQVTLIRPDGIVTFMDETHGYILVKALSEKKVTVPESIREIIDKLNAELIIPMVMHNEVIGVLSLGKKKSDEDYTQDDLDILLPLSRTLAIAISNAQLFDELGKTQAEAAQKEKMAVIGTLSAGINHEICNPLGIARGQCEAFLLNLKDGLYKDKSPEELLEKTKEIMAKVIKETDRATIITKKLSSFAKPAKGEAEAVSIDKVVDEVLTLVGYELKLEKIEVAKTIDKNTPDIVVDKKQLEEVLFNLIRNAGQAIGEKGRITISARELKGMVIIDIQDTGAGIPEEKIKELFNPFFTTKEPGKGTGLGLFIVRQVVEKNGGRIYLKDTKVGYGTTFTLEFPAGVPQKARA
jgi:signal transduction histidine kinase